MHEAQDFEASDMFGEPGRGPSQGKQDESIEAWL